MTIARSLRPFRALFAASVALLAVAAACSTPDIKFVKTEDLSHCGNGVIDRASGESDLDCGGPDCHACALGEGCVSSSDCAEGECLVQYCQLPGCDNAVQDGDETAADCGGSCKPCADGSRCGGPSHCISKSCKEGLCVAPSCDDKTLNGDEAARDCGGSVCDGCPVDSPCSAATDCISASCDPTTLKCVISCLKGTDECDADPSRECETNLLTSARNCGACGHVCALPNAVASCVGGACQIDSCEVPWDRCDIDEDNGCETNLRNDPKNCGACGMECPSVNGTPSCVNSECQVECNTGFGDCDADPSNGCEASVKDVDNCGECKEKCPADADESPFCVDGVCGVTTCESTDYGNCDGDPDDECETDLRDDPENCGRCGGLCSVARGTAGCEAGVCVVTSCEPGWDNCNTGDADGGYADGCEVNTQESAQNCGSCGNACDVDNGSGTCQAGSCAVVACEAGFTNCNTSAPDGGFGDGCETDLASDPDSCGGCGNVCEQAHAVMKCVNAECQLDRCATNWGDCTAAEGCETDVSSNIQHCGSCDGPNSICGRSGATTSACVDGACAPPTCDATHLNCDGNNANGCEATLGTAASCNACPTDGGACGAATPVCVASGSTYRCQANIAVGAPVVGVAQSGLLGNLTHSLQMGTSRLVLVGVVGRSDSSGPSGVAQARPDSVTYGGVTMLKFDELAGPINDSANLYYYYLTDGSSPKLPTGGGNQTIVVDGTKHSPQPKMLVANAVQFTGVNQTTPLVTGDKRTATTAATISSTVTVTTTGTIVYALAGAQYVSTSAGPFDTDLVTPLLMNQNTGGNVLISMAGNTQPRAPGPVTISWTWNYAPTMSVHYPVLIQPAQN